MAGLNKVMIIGNLGADPEMKFMSNGTPVASFRVGVSQSYTGQDGQRKDETEWFSVVVWNKLAELCTQYLNKGIKAYVEGSQRTRSWEGQDGQKKYRTELVASRVVFLDGQKVGRHDESDELPF